MKALKIILASLVLATGFAIPALNAQADGAPKKQAHPRPDRVKQLTEQLDLNADQQAKVKAIVADEQARIKAIARDAEGRADKVRAARQETTKQIRAALTPEQQAKFDDLAKKRAEGAKKARDKKAKSKE
jgi:Spy/CpxP family protein refolding chaperone